ncbi:DUF6296 family protein [Streptomyces griseocarneus]|uniref:DUF6296 family protein n=1 Tax=Streptomyces griseocarneus TaxID=51201 RepID=UPI00167C783B|nr:DUF6296 family protein [Streptomyces griseocarneus]MBZ6477194.1 DUF6296 family protein [Streptomyces griseocarneus]GHG54004.1 hypothetical protein GCM10018779_16560 [Streptomyces griseocarneus]
MSAQPDRYTVVLRPQLTDEDNRPRHGAPLRSAIVEATGEVGVSGSPVYEGDGVQAEIDPETRAVEKVTVDGNELPYGWVAQVMGRGHNH